MLREIAVFRESGLVAIPDHLGYREAACLPCAGVTAWNAIVEQGQVKAGDTVLVQGTGGVSLFALQFAQLQGARVIATSSSDQKLRAATELGAHETINYREVPDWEKRARELTGGAGVDHIIEVGGAGTLARSLKAIRMGGTVSIIGQLTGNTTEISLIPILMQNVRLQGVIVGNRETFINMNRAIALHKLRPAIDHRTFQFHDAPEAFAHMRDGAHYGKVVIGFGTT
jgi:NADPH:quinone reductase-like Zn-dependent oxidoreductase